jgi:hypothetical protein
MGEIVVREKRRYIKIRVSEDVYRRLLDVRREMRRKNLETRDMNSVIKYVLDVYELKMREIEKREKMRIGDVEHMFLKYIVEKILPEKRVFKNVEVWKPLGLDKRTGSVVLSQLAEKGFLKKTSYGRYMILDKLVRLTSGEEFMPKIYKISEGKRKRKSTAMISGGCI